MTDLHPLARPDPALSAGWRAHDQLRRHQGRRDVYLQFPHRAVGTYWFHSHSGFQEPDGAYGAIVIEPKDREPFRYDREYVVQLTDKHPHSGDRIMRNLKMMPDYYNRMQRTAGDFFADVSEKGLGATLSDRSDWGDMRMMPTDIEDVQGSRR